LCSIKNAFVPTPISTVGNFYQAGVRVTAPGNEADDCEVPGGSSWAVEESLKRLRKSAFPISSVADPVVVRTDHTGRNEAERSKTPAKRLFLFAQTELQAEKHLYDQAD
jgi:hypothetical protein